MTTAEILWLVHETTVEHLKSEKPLELRRYLTEVGDMEALIAFDKEQMKSKSDPAR